MKKEVVNDIKAMLPHISEKRIIKALTEARGNTDRAIEFLLYTSEEDHYRELPVPPINALPLKDSPPKQSSNFQKNSFASYELIPPQTSSFSVPSFQNSSKSEHGKLPSSPQIKAEYDQIPTFPEKKLSNVRFSKNLTKKKSESNSQIISPSTNSEPETSDLIQLTRVLSQLPNKEGYLEKKGDLGVYKAWKKRFFSLKGDRMVYYRTKADKLSSKPIGYIYLKEATSIDLTNSSKCTFQINTPSRIWYLRAETKEETDQWLQACLQHASFQEPEVPPSPKGVLLRRDTVRTSELQVCHFFLILFLLTNIFSKSCKKDIYKNYQEKMFGNLDILY